MPLPITHHPPADVLEGREPRAEGRWRGRAAAVLQRRVRLLLVGCGLTVALVGGIAVGAAQDEPARAAPDAAGAAVVDATGVMVVERGDEDPELSGPIQLMLPDRHLFGFAELELSSAAGLDRAEDLWTSRTWGTVHATFEWTTCDGPVAWDFAREALQTGGSMSLRCDDGSLFTAEVTKERYVDATTNHGFQVFVTLADGSYVAG